MEQIENHMVIDSIWETKEKTCRCCKRSVSECTCDDDE